jgi:hypothetical protein
MSEAQKKWRHEFDPKWVDPDGMTEEEYSAAMNKIWPRLAEPDDEGFDLNPDDPRRRFCATSEGVIFSKADPVNEEEKAEAEAIWEKMTGGNYSPAIQEEKKEAKKARKKKEF